MASKEFDKLPDPPHQLSQSEVDTAATQAGLLIMRSTRVTAPGHEHFDVHTVSGGNDCGTISSTGVFFTSVSQLAHAANTAFAAAKKARSGQS